MGWNDSILLKVKPKKIFQTSASNFFHCFSLSFLTCFVNGRKLSKYLVDKIILALSAHKSNNIYNKIQNIWFSLPTYSVLQFPKQCLRKKVVLLNFCLCVYVRFICYIWNILLWEKRVAIPCILIFFIEDVSGQDKLSTKCRHLIKDVSRSCHMEVFFFWGGGVGCFFLLFLLCVFFR